MGNPANIRRFIFYGLILALGWGQEDSTIFDQKIRVRKPNESKIVTINATVNPIDVSPTAYRLSIYPRNRPAEMQIQKIFFPGEPIRIILPADILNSDSLGNMAKLEPMGDNYLHQYRMFDAAEGDIHLTPFDVHVPMDIIQLYVMDEKTGDPIPNSDIRVSQGGDVLTSTQLDTSGYKRVRITTKRQFDEPVLFSIDTEGYYPPWKGWITVPEGLSEKVVYISALEPDSGEAVYTVQENLAPFRMGPENGAEVQFVLIEKEQVAISKVAGDRLYGRVRIYIESQNAYQNVFGWVLRKHIALNN